MKVEYLPGLAEMTIIAARNRCIVYANVAMSSIWTEQVTDCETGIKGYHRVVFTSFISRFKICGVNIDHESVFEEPEN